MHFSVISNYECIDLVSASTWAQMLLNMREAGGGEGAVAIDAQQRKLFCCACASVCVCLELNTHLNASLHTYTKNNNNNHCAAFVYITIGKLPNLWILFCGLCVDSPRDSQRDSHRST